MADDQNTKPTKTMDINDLVRELSKSSTSPATPTPPAPATRPPFPTPKPMLPPMAGSSMPGPFVQKSPMPVNPPPPVSPPPLKPLETPKPQFNAPTQPFVNKPSEPKSSVKPAAPPAPSTPGVKEYQSSIRTMAEDISKIKQGQQPMGVPVPRKVEQVVPAPPVTPPPSKPSTPSQQFKVPSVNLGEAQKTAPLAPSKTFPSISIPGVPKAPAAVMPTPKAGGSMPSVPKMGGAAPAPQIFVPQEEAKGGNRNMLFIGIGVVAVAAGFAYWFFVLRTPAPEVVIQTPTPSATTTATPAPTPIPTLTSIFSGVQQQNISIKATNTLSLFVSDIGKVAVNPGAFMAINATDTKMPSVFYGFSDLVTKLALKIPIDLISNFGNDSAMFVYGQKESFDPKGNLQVGVMAPNRIVIVAELKTPASASQAAVNWETTMSADLKTVFGLGVANKSQPGFLDNSYRGMSIRYRNFPYADKTIDYGIVSAFNGKAYLVVTDSREAIFAAIDKLVSR